MGANDNVTISGNSSLAGGTYNRVSVSGSGRVTSAMECDSLRISGTLTCDGPVKAREIRVSGTANFQSNVAVENTVVSGVASFHGPLKVQRLKVTGTTVVENTLTGGHIESVGSITVEGDCEVERFKVVGAFEVGGLLSADTIDVRMYGLCKAREIGGESIEVREPKGPFRGLAAAFGFTGRTGLEATSVEGDHVSLVKAKVDTVRGRDVELGDGCEVNLVEYTTEFKHARSARVKAARKSEPVHAEE